MHVARVLDDAKKRVKKAKAGRNGRSGKKFLWLSVLVPVAGGYIASRLRGKNQNAIPDSTPVDSAAADKTTD